MTMYAQENWREREIIRPRTRRGSGEAGTIAADGRVVAVVSGPQGLACEMARDLVATHRGCQMSCQGTARTVPGA